MTDAIKVELSPAEKAVKYILGRVVNDRNFSWYMFGTESLALCYEAEAARRGVTREDVEQELVQKYSAATGRLQQARRDVADISIARGRLEAIEGLLSSMRARGDIDSVAFSQLSGLVHCDPADLPGEGA